MITNQSGSSDSKRTHQILALVGVGVMIWSAINPYGYFEWFFLAVPPVLFLIVLVVTYRYFQFTTFTYVMCLIQITVVLIGAKYTCTYMPLFDYFKETFNLSRNHYDRLGHLFQGFVPVFLMRELLIRRYAMKASKMMYFLIFSVALGASALFELMEFAMCVFSGYPSSYILAHQGDIYDTQMDMLMALTGATIAVVFFSRYHNKKISEVEDNTD